MTRIKLLGIALVVAFVGFGWTAVAHAQDNFRAGTNVTIPQGDVVNQTLFASGSTIDIAGTVNGDVFCAGQQITITGNINGDILCAGQTVTIDGKVSGNIRVAGQTVSVSGGVARNLSAVGQTVTIEQSGRIEGDASIGAQSATINGVVGRDLAAAGTAVAINGAINRDVSAAGNSIVLGRNVLIAGNVTYTSVSPMVQTTGAQIGGHVTHYQPPRQDRRQGWWIGPVIGGGFLFALYMLVALLIVSLAVVLVAPQLVDQAADATIRAPWKTLLVGILASFAVPIVIAVLAATVIGFPLALLVGLTWLVVSAVAVPFAAYYLGKLLLGANPASPVLIMLLGAALILVLMMIPLVCIIVWLVAFWFGIGMMVLQLPRLPRPDYRAVTAK